MGPRSAWRGSAPWCRCRMSSCRRCAPLTYFSDITLPGTTAAPLPEAEREQLQLASIDHAMWFHGPFRADEWVLFIQDSHVTGGGHGLARGEFFTADGRHVATAVQEVLMRRSRTDAPPVDAGAVPSPRHQSPGTGHRTGHRAPGTGHRAPAT